MEPFPPAAELAPFIGDAIAQVCLDPHGVQFSFDSGRRLVSEYRLEHSMPDGTSLVYECVAHEGPPLLLHRLLYKKIVALRRNDLSLTFEIEDGSSLTIFADIGPYESGNITGPGFSFTVF